MSINSQADRFFANRQVPYVTPLYDIDYKNDDAVLTWFKENDPLLSNYYMPLFREQKNNLRIFLNTGVNPNYFSPMAAVYIQQGLINDQPDEINVNECNRMVMEQVSLIVANELTPQVLPTNEDYKDKMAAKITKLWLQSMSYDLDLDLQRTRWETQKCIFGECFVVPVWNPHKGDLVKESKEYMDEDLPYLDEDGKKVFDDKGEPYKVKKGLRQGDIDLLNPLPFETMIDPKGRFEDSNWFYWVDWVETAGLKKEYPNKQFRQNPLASKYDGVSDTTKGTSNHTKVWYLFHRSCQFMPQGRYIMCTEDTVLENKDLKDQPSLIESQKLPLIRFTDLELGVGSRAVPIMFRNLRSITGGYNRLTNQIYNNLQAESPKLLVHESAAVDAQRMPTGIVAMEWRGNHQPVWTVPQTNTNSIFKFREDLKQNITEMGLSTPIVRGQTPNAQLDSFVALQHFEDQRIQLNTPAIKGHIKAIEHLYRRMISLGRDHYDKDDPRMIKIVGRNNKYSLKYFDPENLDKNYDITLTTTSNLANSKAARTQFMLTIKREFPGLVDDQFFIDTLGLGESEKFQNAITQAVNSAEAENEEMLNGVAVLPPERYEDLIAHWESHRIPMQGLEYKNSSPDIKELFERHMTATEKLMMEQATESQTFAARITNLRQFPLFYTAIPTNEPPQIPMEGEELGGVPEQTSAQTENLESPPFNEGAQAPPTDEGIAEQQEQPF
jgi:hypothetical protein